MDGGQRRRVFGEGIREGVEGMNDEMEGCDEGKREEGKTGELVGGKAGGVRRDRKADDGESGTGGGGGGGVGGDGDFATERERVRRVGEVGGAGHLFTRVSIVHRRESFLYRPETLDGELSPTRSRQTSRCDSAPFDDIIVTPLAQLIDSLRKVKSNCHLMFKNPATRHLSSTKEEEVASFPPNTVAVVEDRQRLRLETLEELNWCLDQLENIQSDGSAARIATNKFKRMLNRELYQYAESDKERTQVTKFISRTFLNEDNGSTKKDHMVVKVDVETSEKQSKVPLRNEALVTETVDQPRARVGSGQKTRRTNVVAFSGTELSTHCIPKYGVDVPSEETLSQHMRNLNNWGMDMFSLYAASAHSPLTAVTYTILQERGLLNTFRISPDVLLKFLHRLEMKYHPDVPYHNSLHAADVAQSCHVLLRLQAFQNVFSDLEIFATIFAGAIHDVDHPGFNNQFLINSNSDLALLYNDGSVLENHHLAVAFGLLRGEGCDVFQNLPNKQRQNLRQLIIGMVLATDMSKHMQHLGHLKTMVELRQLAGNSQIETKNPSHREQILQSLVHCADLSNPTKSWAVYSKWTTQIMEEFFRQGDQEKKLGIDVSPMCDRDTARVANSQIGFIDFVVLPLWETWADLVFPDCQEILETLENNRHRQQLYLENDDATDHHPHAVASDDRRHDNRRQPQLRSLFRS